MTPEEARVRAAFRDLEAVRESRRKMDESRRSHLSVKPLPYRR